MGNYSTMGGFAMELGWLVPTLFIFTLIFFINKLLNSDTSARDILDKKYANGEINEKEYRIKREALNS